MASRASRFGLRHAVFGQVSPIGEKSGRTRPFHDDRIGGETGDEHAAGLHVADTFDWPVVDLRVDWHDDPIGELRRIWNLYAPQRAAYESRARAPGTAPGF